MGIYKQGLNRKQQLMFPPSLDELVEEDNVVRTILSLGYFLERFLFLQDIPKLANAILQSKKFL